MFRRIILLTVAIAMLALPSSASATFLDPNCPSGYVDVMCEPGDATLLAPLPYTGWTYLNLNYCPKGNVCAAIYRDSTLAWRWTGKAWGQTTIRQGWVYLYPYTGQWRWAWTPASGWVAISGARFELRKW